MIYFDNAATTFPKPECVYNRTDYVQRNLAFNVGRGSYDAARKAMDIVDETRMLLALQVNALSPSQVVFTPSATIAINEIILGIDWAEHNNVYLTPFEHNAVARPLEIIKENHNINIHFLPFDPTSLELDFDKMCRMFINDPPEYVFLNHVSNVVGNIIPISEITNEAKKYGAVVICDASQSIGLLPIDIQKSNIDFIVFAGHKNLYSLFGVGGFITNDSYKLSSKLAGGTGSDSLSVIMPKQLPQAYEFASPNIIAISSLNESLKWLNSVGLYEVNKHKKNLMHCLINGVSNNKKIVVYLPQNLDYHTSVLSINIDGYLAEDVGMILDHDYDIAVRTGYHCAPYIHDLIGSKNFQGTVRISIGFFNTENDIASITKALSKL